MIMKKQRPFLFKPGVLICLLVATLMGVTIRAGESNPLVYHSPYDLAYSPDGRYLAVANATAASLDIVDLRTSSVAQRIPLNGEPRGVAWHENLIFAAEYGAGTTAVIDWDTYKVIKRYQTGSNPTDLTVFDNKLLVTEFNEAKLYLIDLDTAKIIAVETKANPYSITVSPNGSYALIGHLAPDEEDPEKILTAAASVSVVDLSAAAVSKEINLPHGASNLRKITISHDGRWAYVTHTLGKTNLPLTHITKGWVNTNAVTIIDLDKQERYVTFLLDRISEGAANPWGTAISGDGQTLWVSISGVHQVVKLDLEHLHWLLAGEGPEFRDDLARNMIYRSKAEFDRPYSDVWFKIKDDPKNLELLQNDLGALWSAGLMEIIQLPGRGPRSIAVSPDNTRIAVGAYYSGEIYVLDADTSALIQVVSLGEQPPETNIRRGERLFHDATLSQQSWLSCSTCHPGGSADGLAWDLPDSRFGNPVRTITLDTAYQKYGENLRQNIRDAYWVEMITQPKDEDVEAMFYYLKSLGE